MESPGYEETEALLGLGHGHSHSHSTQAYYDTTKRPNHGTEAKEKRTERRSLYWILPVPLLASLAMAATVATTIRAYAELACRDSTRCSEEEQGRYAGTLALATSVAHFAGLFVIGPLQALVKRDVRVAMTVWIASRAVSVAAVPIAGVALVGRLFEGAASDNSLHFVLNSVYTQAPFDVTSRLMGTSLALFMIGMSFGPISAGLFSDYRVSFAIALILLIVSTLYTWLFVPSNASARSIIPSSEAERRQEADEPQAAGSFVCTFLSPILPFYHRPALAYHGIAMFLFTAVQSYLFPAIMIHASIVFGFDSTQTGWIVSIGAGTSALYLATILYAIPQLRKSRRTKNDNDAGSNRTSGGEAPDNDDDDDDDSRGRAASIAFDTRAFVACVCAQAAAALAMTWLRRPQPFLVAVAASALGLGAGSFLKSQLANKVGDGDARAVIALLSVAETLGGLASPLVLGSWQAFHAADGSIFPLVAAMLGSAVVAFLLGTWRL